MYSVVIPVHNESSNIVGLLQEIVTVLGRVDYEMVVVDDASTDDTLLQLVRAKRRMLNLRVLKHTNRCGQSAALRTGILAARHHVIVTLDGDGQNDPADIPKLLETYQRVPGNVGLVIGYRTKRNDNFVRKISSRIANAIRAFWLRDQTPDTGCGLKVFKKETFLQLPYFDHIHRFFPALIARAGYDVLIASVNHRQRMAGQSKYGVWNRLWVGIVDLFGVRWLQSRYRIPTKVEEV